jgi:hypothetical protein
MKKSLPFVLILISVLLIKQSVSQTWIATWSSPSLGTTSWCSGEVRVVSITVKNSGTATWPFGGANPVRIGATWDADISYPYRTYMTADLPANGSVTLSITVTAPVSAGSHTLYIDMVHEGICWFANVSGLPYCGNGSLRYTSPTQTVSALAPPTATISGGTAVCQNGTSPNITFTNPQTAAITITYNINGTGTPTINVAASSTATVAAPTSTTGTFTYNLVSAAYQSAPICPNPVSGSTTVTVKVLPTANITSVNTTICIGGSTNITGTVTATGAWTLTLSNSGGTANGSGNGSFSLSVSPVATSTYTIASLSDANCAAASAGLTGSTMVTVNTKSADPILASASNNPICSGTNSVLILSGGGGGTGETIHWYTGSCSGTLVGTGNNFSVSPTLQTTYYGRYEDSSPCVYNSNCAQVTVYITGTGCSPTTVGQLPVLGANVPSQKNISCFAGSDGSITIQASGGTGPYQYSIDNGVTYTTGLNPNPYVVTGLTAGPNYKIRVKDANNCESPPIP